MCRIGLGRIKKEKIGLDRKWRRNSSNHWNIKGRDNRDRRKCNKKIEENINNRSKIRYNIWKNNHN
jgi:hypothetical protein